MVQDIKMNKIFLIYFLIALISLNITKTVQKSDIQLKNYENLKYDDFKIENINSRKRRDNNQTISDLSFSQTRLKFHAFDRDFVVLLTRDRKLVSNNLDIEVRYSFIDKPDLIEHHDNYFASNNYIGFVEGESKSSVVCYLENKEYNSENELPLIYAQIRLENNDKKEYFYIEPSFINDYKNQNEAKYIVYRSDDINSGIISNGIFNTSVCQPKYVDNMYDEDTVEMNNRKILKRDTKLIMDKKNYQNKRKNRCNVALVADYKFFTNIGNSNVRQTTAYLLNIMGAINSIFTNTIWKFEEDTPMMFRKDYGFSVDKVIVLINYEEKKTEHYNLRTSSTDADKILQLFSKDEDWTPYCLAHLFTYQTFQHNVLGLAYVSSPLSYTLGGICSKPQYRKNNQYSLNIGLSSYKSVSIRQGRLLQREAELVTAHEFGHNWGSEHDPDDSTCSPARGPDGGNYLMYMYSNQGHDRNNDNFSPCSINSISQVLKTKADCFIAEKTTYCGNGYIEDNEECDSGLDTQKGIDPCCNKFCKLKPDAQCSDANHNCCLNCRIAREGYKCWSSPNYLECFQDHSYCNGRDKHCPTQEPLKAGSECKSYDFGKCDSTGHCLSLCQQKGTAYLPCLCTKKEEKCRICCRYSSGNITSECIPFDDTNNIRETKFGKYYLSEGRPCSNGICNKKHVCEQMVNDYVTRFWKVIQTVTVSGFVEFMKRNIVGTIILISLSFWIPFSCCIHFCIDKRNRAMQKQKLQSIQKEIIKNRNSGFQSHPARSSNSDVRERLLIRTENFDNKQGQSFL